MLLNTFERLILLNILPREGDFTTLKIVRKMREDLSFSEQEHKDLSITIGEKGQVKWKTEADRDVEISIGEKATDIIVSVLKKLNAEKKLTEQHFSLYEKFVGE
jgi:hypothetical protein